MGLATSVVAMAVAVGLGTRACSPRWRSAHRLSWSALWTIVGARSRRFGSPKALRGSTVRRWPSALGVLGEAFDERGPK
jgi:hypothetical protein